MSWFDDFKEGFKDRYGEGKEDYRLARYEHNAARGRDAEGSRWEHTLATNPTFVTIDDLKRKALGQQPTPYENKRREMGMGLSEDRTKAIGQVAGTIANDFTQDTTRSLWWLLNAPQAVGNVLNETLLAHANPELFRHEVYKDSQDKEIRKHLYRQDGELRFSKTERDGPDYLKLKAKREAEHEKAVRAGLISEKGQIKKGVQTQYNNRAGGPVYTKRKFNPGDVAALGIPTGIAINAGIGLLSPLGGMGGYSAVLPSEDDLTKTNNVIGEVAAKYILGRTGNLLPYEEFSKYRPDVDVGEYNRYKAFKYDKDLDYDISDGDLNLLPAGVLKYTSEGIHGPEVQFLGRSLPLTTALIPYAGALVGGVAGAWQPTKRDKKGNRRLAPIDGKINKRPITRSIRGGFAGLAAGAGVGLIAEEIRRRASSNANQMAGGSAEQYLG